MSNVSQITPAELKQQLEAGTSCCILDVREGWEVAIARLPEALHIPLSEIPARLKELDAQSSIIVMCKAGGRSQRAADFLAARGFTKVANLRGGIDAWARDVDPSMPTY